MSDVKVQFQIIEESVETLPQQAEVSIAYEYDRLLELTVNDKGLGGFVFTERQLDAPRRKDYDAIGDDKPSKWSTQFDVSKWGFLVARSEGRRVGGAVIAFDSPTAHMLEGRRDLAVLWDIRVAADFRSHGVGAALFDAVEHWAKKRECTQLKIETQNTNLAACQFYARQGCTLAAIDRLAYPLLPHEIKMVWCKELK